MMPGLHRGTRPGTVGGHLHGVQKAFPCKRHPVDTILLIEDKDLAATTAVKMLRSESCPSI